ncbi:sulfatase [Neiella litorisoli]|nr:sulfatase [Neiella litorisoli]
MLRLTVLLSLLISAVCSAQTPPNILLILSDDAGYADFGFHGSQVMKTPHLDQLAKQGIQFTQAYVTAAVCGPSRAGLLTGRYQQKFGYEENNVPGYMSSSELTGDDMGLPLDQMTIADHLKKQGYTTGLFGKWHMGNADRFHPLKRGFDTFYGFRGGARSYYEFNQDNVNTRQEDYLERDFGNFEESPKYLTDALADATSAFIEANQNQPFFAFLSFNAVHTPMEADPADRNRFPELTPQRQTLAAMTFSMDRAIGRVLSKLDELNLSANTIVIYTNDNGGPSDTNYSDNTPLSGTKANHLEGGIRVPMLMRWPSQLAANRHYQFPVSTLDLLPTLIQASGGTISANDDLDGVDLWPYLTGQRSSRPHPLLYWKKENRAAIRSGDWKLLRFPDRPAELYDLSSDIGEQHNLAQHHPAKVRQLYQQLFQWELTLERPKWQLKRVYEGKAMERMDNYRRGQPATE